MAQVFAPPRLMQVFTTPQILRFCDALDDVKDSAVEIDCGQLGWVDPLGLCAMACTFERLERSGISIAVRGLLPEVGSYLKRMDLFKNCRVIEDDQVKPAARINRSDRLVEVHKINAPGDIASTAFRLANAVVGIIPGIDPTTEPDEMTGRTPADDVGTPIQYVFSELLENSLTHGRHRGFNGASVWVAAQYYPSRDSIKLAILDDGCGFLETLAEHPQINEKTHAAAIEVALLPKVSCNRDLAAGRDSVNQGVGLTVTREIALRAQGFISLFSGDGWLRDTPRGRVCRSLEVGWQGVGAYVELRRGALQDIEMAAILRSLPGYEAVPGLRFE